MQSDPTRVALPIDALLPELLATLDTEPVVLLQAPPGAGKTTRVPPALLKADWRRGRRILVLEPRRLAARAAARFIAQSFGESVGGRIGLRTRLETRVSKHTQIEIVTEGILIRMLQNDPTLAEHAAVVFDEFHERSLSADLGLALLRESRQALREDLRLLVMSATLSTETLADRLGAPTITSEGRSYPIDVVYCPLAPRARLTDAAAAAVRRALADDRGSILVFLPGAGEIGAVARALGNPDGVDVLALHGMLPPGEQDAAIAPAAEGRRKVVLATDIAETSLTIEGVRVVIDAGQARRSRFDPGSGMSRLVTERVSRASATQRAGRAGRTEPGSCYRLWSETDHARRPAFAAPEIAEADLAPLALELAAWGARSPDELAWLDPPPEAHWRQAVDLLIDLGALDAQRTLTAMGREMHVTGVHPRLARMLVRGRELGASGTAANLAALLDERDVLGRDAGVDLAARLALVNGESSGSDVRRGALERVRKLANRLARNQRDRNENADPGELLAVAFPDRIARRREGGPARYQLANGRGAWLPDDDPLAGAPWLVAVETDGQAREARIFRAVRIDEDVLERALADRIERVESADWDEARGTVVVVRQRRLGALVLEQREAGPPDPEQQQAGLLAAVRRKGIDALNWTEATTQLCQRVETLRALAPEDWPAMDRATLAGGIDQWLAPFLAGITRWRELASMNLMPALEHRLGHAEKHKLDRLAPTRIEVPAGQAVRLDYGAESDPVLAVKLQAVFGWTETPRIADGRLPVVLHLLDPAGRPLAVTSDLASFWANAYPEVAGQMRGRYPKHPWPDDPVSAPATLRTKPR